MKSFPTLEIEEVLWQNGYQRIAGIDEAGRGPLAGPVVAAAVVFAPGVTVPGVRDSKQLTEKQRETLFEDIVQSCLAYGIGVVEPADIDRLNIRQATFLAMRKALGAMKITPDYLLVDGEELPNSLYPQEAIVGGDDKSFTIAAASILAKVTRDRMMKMYHEQFPQYHFDRHKGYGTQLHREMILRYGPSPIHRRSFLKKLLRE